MTDDLQLLQMARLGCQLQLNELDERIAHLTGRQPAGAERDPALRKKRTMSAAARKRIADAQRKRWAAARKAPTAMQPSKPAKPAKKGMSAAAKERIRKANQKRWAEYRAKKADAGKRDAKTATATS